MPTIDIPLGAALVWVNETICVPAGTDAMRMKPNEFVVPFRVEMAGVV